MTQNPWGPPNETSSGSGSGAAGPNSWGPAPRDVTHPAPSASEGRPNPSYPRPDAYSPHGPSSATYPGQRAPYPASATFAPPGRPGPARIPQPSRQAWPNQQWGEPQQQPWGQPAQQQPSGQQWGPPAGQQPQQPWSATGPAAYRPAPTYPGQYGYPQPYPTQPWQYPAPPARKRSPLLPVLGGVLALLLLFGAAVAYVLVGRPGDDPTRTPSPSASATTKYVNDDYAVPDADPHPPALPDPNSSSQAHSWIEDSALYREAVPIPVRCELQEIDVEQAGDSELEQHINDEVACLMRVWGPTVQSAGFTMYRPTVTVYEQRITTKCGEAKDKNAFYCGGDQQIYYAQNLYASLPPEDQGKRWSIEAIIAHEFGHAVQGRTGILTATHGLQSAGGISKSDKNQLNRQLELQADCFAGAFLQSVSTSMQMTSDEKSMLTHMFFDMGDDVLSGQSDIDAGHGSGVNRQYWMNQGLSAKTLAQCNTFTAAPEQTR